MNLCQNPEYYSYPLFQICGGITGFLYLPKLKRIGNVMTYMTISGEGFSTGKSLMADVCRLALYGSKKECNAPTTVSTLYDMLSKGKAIYGKNC